MNLSILNRIVLYFSILPLNGSIEEMVLSRNIKSKIALTEEENSKGIVLDKNKDDQIYLKYLSDEAAKIIIQVDFTDDELKFIKALCLDMSNKKSITELALDTVLLFTK